jgi:hypothetical protein
MKANQFGIYKELPIGQLLIDHAYQRQVSPSFVKKVTANFDESLIGAIRVVTRKNKTFAVVDGQHRLAVLKALGYETVPCLVYPEMSFQEEVAMFHDLNQGVHKLTSLEDFWALVSSGDEDSIAILQTIEKNGLKVAKRSGERESLKQSISAIGIIRQIVRNYKLDVLDKTLSFATKIWPANGEALSGQLLEGVSIFIKRHADNPVYNPKNAQRKLMGLTLPLIIAKARNQAKIYETRTCYVIADLLCEAYNKGLSKERKLTWGTMENQSNAQIGG